MSTQKQKFYVPELDGLRFFAFLLVFVGHAPYFRGMAVFETLHEFGWIGVDLFFCLSAFLITKLLTIEYEADKSIHIFNFYVRRILKIWPLYFLFIIFLVIYSVQYHEWNSTTQQRITGMLFFSDNILAAFLGYNHLFSSFHLWTISYEEQFYVFIPWLILKIIAAGNKMKSIFIITPLFLVSLARAIFIYSNIPHPAIWALPITHFESILGGTALGLGILDGIFNKLHSQYLLFLGLISIYIVFELPNTNIIGWKLMFTYPLTGIGMVMILHTVVYGNLPIIKDFLGNKTIVYLGRISYGLYVYHILCLTIANQICNRLDVIPSSLLLYPFAMSGIGMMLTIALATASYYVYERPFLILKNKFTEIRSRPI